jgi:putative hydrolase of the HAD superfamily
MNSPIFLFDVDGVVIRANGYFSRAFCENHKLPKDFFDKYFREDHSRTIVGTADAHERMTAYLVGTPYEGRTDEVFEEWFEYNSLANGEILDLADRLRSAGYPVALATNQEKYRMEYLLETLGLGSWFDEEYPSWKMGHVKPSKEYFEAVGSAVKERFGERRIHFVDDTAENIDMARSVGWEAYMFDQDDAQGISKLEKTFAEYLPKE